MMQMHGGAETERGPHQEQTKPISMYWVLVDLAPLAPELECPKVCN